MLPSVDSFPNAYNKPEGAEEYQAQFPRWVAGTQLLDPSSAASQEHWQGYGWEVEQRELEPVLW